MFKLRHMYDRVTRPKRGRTERHLMIIKVTYGRETPYKAGEYVFVKSTASRSEEKFFTARLESDYDPKQLIRGDIQVTPNPVITSKKTLEISPGRIQAPGYSFKPSILDSFVSRNYQFVGHRWVFENAALPNNYAVEVDLRDEQVPQAED